MKFWLCASLSATGVFSAVIPAARTAGAQVKPDAQRVSETLLAGLRPGRDTLAIAEKRFKTKSLSAQDLSSRSREWRDSCSGRIIRLELDAKSLIQSVTLTTLGLNEGKCSDK